MDQGRQCNNAGNVMILYHVICIFLPLFFLQEVGPTKAFKMIIVGKPQRMLFNAKLVYLPE